MAHSVRNTPHSLSVKRGLIVLAGCAALLIASAVIEPYMPTETTQDSRVPTPSPAEAKAAASVIRSAGYDCDGVYLIEPAARFPHKGITVLCKNRYSFLVEDHGGRLIVTSQGDWY
jgi:hypothetical protein